MLLTPVVLFYKGGRAPFLVAFSHGKISTAGLMKTTLLDKRDVLASNLLYIWLVVSFVSSVLRPLLHIVPPPRSALAPVALLLISLVYAGFFYAIRIGKRWARILLAVLSVGAISTSAATFHSFQTDFLNILSYTLYVASHVWALVLVFRKPAEACREDAGVS